MQGEIATPVSTTTRSATTSEVSLFRLYVLRATYLLLVVGLARMVWPGMLTHATTWELYHGVTNCFLTTISLLALIGIRYPVRMLPLLLFEMTWKVIWLLAIGLPLYLAHRVDGDTRETIFNCLMGVVIVPLVIPWGYVYAKYLAAKGDRWR